MGCIFAAEFCWFCFVGGSTSANSRSFSFGSDQMFTLSCGRSLIALRTPPCFVLWLHDGLSFLWISFPRRSRASSGMSSVNQVSVKQRISYPNLPTSFAKASRLLKSRRLITLKISVRTRVTKLSVSILLCCL